MQWQKQVKVGWHGVPFCHPISIHHEVMIILAKICYLYYYHFGTSISIHHEVKIILAKMCYLYYHFGTSIYKRKDAQLFGTEGEAIWYCEYFNFFEPVTELNEGKI